MKYIFTTLSIGEDYLGNAESFFEDCSNRTSADFNITTNSKKTSTERINYDILEIQEFNDKRNYCPFYFNLKSLSLKPCISLDYDFVIYVDSDWRLHKNFEEDKILRMFDFMNTNDIDFLFERPGTVGGHKKNYEQSFCKNKLLDYNVFVHDKWDEAHITNEQFLVFKNNDKLKFFVQRWEQFLWYSIKNNIWNYCEGFEIGVSALESGMNIHWDAFRGTIQECFEFNDRYGNYHARF
jgi:hypothetical protein